VTENIFRPLAIVTDQPFQPSPKMVERMALPYDRGTNGVLKPIAQFRTAEYPAGNAFLTAEEMARFLGALINGGVFQGKKILSASSVREMQTARFTGNYGLGLRVREAPNGHRMIRHAGSLPGLSSLMIGDVDAHVGVYYMANVSDFGYRIADAAILLLRGEDYPPAPRGAAQLNPEVLAPIAGKYQMGADIFTISLEDKTLFLQKNERAKRTPILAQNADNFYIEEDRSTIHFEKNGAGKISRMIILDPEWQMKTAVRLN
jgi:CubicO group peptidase (beta-lactamase class C family)